MYKRNMGPSEYSHFPNLSPVSVKKEDSLTYCKNLDNVYTDFSERFKDILNMNIPDWVIDPFTYVNIDESSHLKEELIELITNEELKIKFKSGYQEFWLQKPISTLYPGLWKMVQKFLIAFPSSFG